MKRKVLITGSNGLLGQKLVKQLVNHNEFDLIATSRGNNRIESTKGFTYLSLDITSEEEVKTFFTEHKPDVVINTAAMTNVDACEDDQDACWKINVDAVQFLLNSCEEFSSHLIHLSTDFIFDGENGPYKETDTPNPLSFYAKSKLASEELLEESNYDNWAIARTIIVFGTGDNLSRSNVVLWALGALAKQDDMNVVDDQFRSPTFAEDLAKGCIQIAEHNATGIYHLSGKDIMSILELVHRVAKFLNVSTNKVKPIKTASLGRKAARPPKTGFVLDKAARDIGYNPRSFEEALEELQKQLQ